jgi:hypothetical protein
MEKASGGIFARANRKTDEDDDDDEDAWGCNYTSHTSSDNH